MGQVLPPLPCSRFLSHTGPSDTAFRQLSDTILPTPSTLSVFKDLPLFLVLRKYVFPENQEQGSFSCQESIFQQNGNPPTKYFPSVRDSSLGETALHQAHNALPYLHILNF